jgi:hypothetical protein
LIYKAPSSTFHPLFELDIHYFDPATMLRGAIQLDEEKLCSTL